MTQAEISLETAVATFGRLDGRTLVEALRRAFPGRMAVTSSFGAESAVLLDLVAQVDPAIPVLSVDTGCLFPETVAYRELLRRRLGLRDLRIVRPTGGEIARQDPDGALWWSDSDACCALRKIVPLEKATIGFSVLIDGRKRFHGQERAEIATVESAGGLLKAAPLATWSEARIERAFVERDLPRHPLVAQGYRSIGCRPCTEPTADGAPIRAGRWSGKNKTECGIHLSHRYGT